MRCCLYIFISEQHRIRLIPCFLLWTFNERSDEEMETTKLSTIMEKIGIRIVCILSGCIAFWLSIVSLLHTVRIENVADDKAVRSSLYFILAGNESVIYHNDNMFLNIVYLFISLILICVLSSKLAKIRLSYKLLFLFLWTFLLGTVWVLSSQSAPTFDSLEIVKAASAFGENDYSVLENGVYFKEYSFQLGYVFFCEIIMKLVKTFASPENVIYLEVMNAFFLGAINVFVVKICDLTIRDERVSTAVTLMLALSCAPIISCSFIYGIIPGMFFAVIAFYFELRYLMEDRLICGIMAVVYITIAVMIKSNYLIWLIAMVLIAGGMMFRRKKYLRDSIICIIAVILSLTVQPAVKKMYESRSGVDLGEAIPYSAWIAMGLNEAQSAPGWFSYIYTTEKFEKNEFDAGKTGEEAGKNISDRLKKFVKEPQYTNDFFYKKTASQWNETSYESIWNNTIRGQFKDKNAFADWVCNKGSKKVRKYMDIWAQLLFVSFTAGIVMIMKKKDFPAVSLAVIFLGGFFYQLISEGKSQYIMPYIIVMTGIAGYGAILLGDLIADRYRKRKNGRTE